jgi:hypothetical protein
MNAKSFRWVGAAALVLMAGGAVWAGQAKADAAKGDKAGPQYTCMSRVVPETNFEDLKDPRSWDLPAGFVPVGGNTIPSGPAGATSLSYVIACKVK